MKPQGLAPHAQQNLFGGQGTVLVYDLLRSQSMPPFDSVLACELEAGGTVGTHVQQVSHEIVVKFPEVGGDETISSGQHVLNFAYMFTL